MSALEMAPDQQDSTTGTAQPAVVTEETFIETSEADLLLRWEKQLKALHRKERASPVKL